MNLQLVAMQKISSTWFIHESQFFIRRKAMQELLNYDTPHGHNYQYRDVGPCYSQRRLLEVGPTQTDDILSCVSKRRWKIH